MLATVTSLLFPPSPLAMHAITEWPSPQLHHSTLAFHSVLPHLAVCNWYIHACMFDYIQKVVLTLSATVVFKSGAVCCSFATVSALGCMQLWHALWYLGAFP